MAAWTATFGTVIVFVGAYLVEKTKDFAIGRSAVQFLAMLPLAVPGWSSARLHLLLQCAQ